MQTETRDRDGVVVERGSDLSSEQLASFNGLHLTRQGYAGTSLTYRGQTPAGGLVGVLIGFASRKGRGIAYPDIKPSIIHGRI